MRLLWLDIVALVAVWALVVVAVNPCGEFMVNDDWAFVRSLETLKAQTKLPTTGWGPEHAPGGPSLIVHLLWGLLFTKIAGFSLTALRLSVLSLGIVGSVALLVLLRLARAPHWLALAGAFTLVFNPLYLSLSFTFMTDVTFTAVALLSMLFLWLGRERSHTGLVVIGFICALAMVLIRQVGLVIPLGFAAACLLHPDRSPIGPLKVFLLALLIVVGPWILYEAVLAYTGGTPFTRHQIIHDILRRPLEKGFPDYAIFLARQLVHAALGYTCLLISPVVAIRLPEFIRKRWFRYTAAILTAALIVVEAGMLTGTIALPVVLHRNVIYDLGLGPVLLRDTYILGATRTWMLPPWLFYLVAYWGVISMVTVAACAASSLKDLLRGRGHCSFLGAFALLCAFAYLVVILLTGFHDRYLIPLCAFLILWFIAETPPEVGAFSIRRLGAAAVPLVVTACFSVPAMHDFMELKRSIARAHDFLVNDLKTDPCRVDGGFEFNGYHCYRSDFVAQKGVSWWWVSAEDYLVTLGPLPGYRVIQTFPFRRWLGPVGEVFILRPEAAGSGREADGKTSLTEGGTIRRAPDSG